MADNSPPNTNNFIGEIRIFAFNQPPQGWALCNGQSLPVKQNTALYSLLKDTYGGDATNFNLPNLQGCVAIQSGQGPNLSNYELGQTGGSDKVTLQPGQLPSHQHSFNANDKAATAADPTKAAYCAGEWKQGQDRGEVFLYTHATPDTGLRQDAISQAGGGQPHNNLMPYLTVNYCIALQGIFPART
jgi:microcystin-dependent protein